MLRVDERLAECGFAGLKQERIAAIGDGRRVEAEHRGEHDAAGAQRMFGARHEPARRIKLVAAARAALLRVHEKCLAHEHRRPVAGFGHDHRHLPRVWVHGGPARHVHQIHAGAVHVMHVVHVLRASENCAGGKKSNASVQSTLLVCGSKTRDTLRVDQTRRTVRAAGRGGVTGEGRDGTVAASMAAAIPTETAEPIAIGESRGTGVTASAHAWTAVCLSGEWWWHLGGAGAAHRAMHLAAAGTDATMASAITTVKIRSSRTDSI